VKPRSPVSSHPHWSKAAVASAILGPVGFFTLWLGVGLFLAAAGAVCGHVAQHWISHRRPRVRGRGLAGFGLATSYLTLFFFPLFLGALAVAYPTWQRMQTSQWEKMTVESENRASQLFVACEAYARANGDRYPREWGDLAGRFVPRHELNRLLRSPYPGGGEEAFEIVPHERPVLPQISDSVIVIQELAPSEVSRVAVVHADGNVSFILNPNRP